MRPVLVGLDNPYTPDPRYALYPHPPTSAGGRLYRMIAAAQDGDYRIPDYLRDYDRRNLCFHPAPTAPRRLREAGERLLERLPDDAEVVFALGRPVACALGMSQRDPALAKRVMGRIHVVHLPHPSGLTRWYNEPDHRLVAGAALSAARAGEEDRYCTLVC